MAMKIFSVQLEAATDDGAEKRNNERLEKFDKKVNAFLDEHPSYQKLQPLQSSCGEGVAARTTTISVVLTT